jgi:hypothetical protein
MPTETITPVNDRHTRIDRDDGSRTEIKTDRDGHRVDHHDREGRRVGGEVSGTGYSHKEVVRHHSAEPKD